MAANPNPSSSSSSFNSDGGGGSFEFDYLDSDNDLTFYTAADDLSFAMEKEEDEGEHKQEEEFGNEGRPGAEESDSDETLVEEGELVSGSTETDTTRTTVGPEEEEYVEYEDEKEGEQEKDITHTVLRRAFAGTRKSDETQLVEQGEQLEEGELVSSTDETVSTNWYTNTTVETEEEKEEGQLLLLGQDIMNTTVLRTNSRKTITIDNPQPLKQNRPIISSNFTGTKKSNETPLVEEDELLEEGELVSSIELDTTRTIGEAEEKGEDEDEEQGEHEQDITHTVLRRAHSNETITVNSPRPVTRARPVIDNKFARSQPAFGHRAHLQQQRHQTLNPQQVAALKEQPQIHNQQKRPLIKQPLHATIRHTLADFLKMAQEDGGVVVESPAKRLGGAEWKLRVKINGNGTLGIFLVMGWPQNGNGRIWRRKLTTTKYEVKMTARILHSVVSTRQIRRCRNTPLTFELGSSDDQQQNTKSWGFGNMCSVQELRRFVSHNGELGVEVDFTILNIISS